MGNGVKEKSFTVQPKWIALSWGGVIASEHILTLSHVQLFYATLHTYLVMQQLAVENGVKHPTLQTKRPLKTG